MPPEPTNDDYKKCCAAGYPAGDCAETFPDRAEDGEGPSFRESHPEEWNTLQRWNALQQQQGAPTLTGPQAQEALRYAEAGFTFEQALNLYSKWVQGADLPSPTEIGDWMRTKTQEAWYANEISRMQAAAAAPTAGAPQAIGQLLSQEARQLPLVQQIFAQTPDDRVRLSMILAALLEGGSLSGPWASGDDGAAHGPFQIHALSFEEANDLARAVQFMLEEHQGGAATFIAAVEAIPDELWQSDPLAAATLAVANAERVGGWHEGLTAEEAATIYGGREHIEARWQQAGEVPTAVGGGALRDVAATPYAPVEAAGQVGLEALIYNSDLPRPFTGAELSAGAVQFPNLSGVALIDAMLAATGRPLTDQEAAAIRDARQMAIEMRGKIDEWSDEDKAFIWREGMTLEDVVETVRAGQTPEKWWRGKMDEAKEYLARFDLTMEDAGVMQEYGIPIQEYQVMHDLEMTPQNWVRTSSTFGGPLTPDEIFAAAKMGYDPSVVRPEQIAAIKLRTDLSAQVTRLTGQITEDIRPDIDPRAFAEDYYGAQQEARMRGELLLPEDFLRSDYPGLFGGGTARELRVDLEKIGRWQEAGTVRGPDIYRQPTTYERVGPYHKVKAATYALERMGGIFSYEGGRTPGGRGTHAGDVAAMVEYADRLRRAEYPAAQEMYAERAQAQAFLGAPGPLGTQTREEWLAQREKVAARYPELAGREEEGEFETEEAKRRRELKAKAKAGLKGPAIGKGTPASKALGMVGKL